MTSCVRRLIAREAPQRSAASRITRQIHACFVGAAVFCGALLPARAVVSDVDRAAVISLSASVLKVEAMRVQGGFSLGSGVVVGPDRVVTNCHVTRDAREIHVLRGDMRWLVKAQTSDIDHDLCVLRVPGLKAESVKLGSAATLAVGEPVLALGFTGGLGLQASAGEVLALHRFDGSQVVQSSNFFNSGASGGGLFDAKLRLVGILSFRLRGGEAHYFAAPSDWLVRQLDAAEHDVAPAAATDLAFWQRPIAAQPTFLQAQVLERDSRWAALEPLAAAWIRTDAADAEPWYLLGLAQSELGRPGEARRAFGCALAIDANLEVARRRLAALDERDGNALAPAFTAPAASALPVQAAASAPCAPDLHR